MNAFKKPPLMHTSDGHLRRVGFELEYGNLEIPEALDIIQGELKGGIEKVNPWHYRIHDATLGTFTLMLDYQLIAEAQLPERLHDLGFETPMSPDVILAFETFIATMSTPFVPFELTTPPLPLDHLSIIESLKTQLAHAGAVGTGADPMYAYGLHINPETPRMDVTYLLSILRSFFLLYDYLVEMLHPNMTRRLSPYIIPFEESYGAHILNPSYQPTMSRFINDYLIANPTRNRPLDMLPLLAWIDEKRVFAAVHDQKISSRPAFHYRLPNSHIDDASWSIATEWNYWTLIETLAFDEEKLCYFCHKRLQQIKRSFTLFERSQWIERMAQWVAQQPSP